MKLYTIGLPPWRLTERWEVRADQGCLVAERPGEYEYLYRVVCPACPMSRIHRASAVAAVLQKVWE